MGTNADGKGYTAIQCKFYAQDAIVPKKGIDSFLAASSKSFFTSRIIVATNENWSENVKEELLNNEPPVFLITRETLANSAVDWSLYLKTGQLKQIKKRTPRAYQKEAIRDVIKGFEKADRGKLIMACGTGKTYTSLKITEELIGRGGLVLFLAWIFHNAGEHKNFLKF